MRQLSSLDADKNSKLKVVDQISVSSLLDNLLTHGINDLNQALLTTNADKLRALRCLQPRFPIWWERCSYFDPQKDA